MNALRGSYCLKRKYMLAVGTETYLNAARKSTWQAQWSKTPRGKQAAHATTPRKLKTLLM